VHAAEGMIRVHSETGLWVTPPQRAVCIPAKMEHSVVSKRPFRLLTLYVKSHRLQLSGQCQVIAVDTLVEALLTEAVPLGADYPLGDARPLESWARQVAMTPKTFARHFVAETSMTFGRWRNQLRLLAAIELLGQSMSVTEVAFTVGYEDVSSFIAAFKAQLGVTPSRYFD
jgi:AraC-like DNA-binding protein